MKLADQIQVNIKQIPHENNRIKFDHELAKKMNNVESLGKMLIQQEKEFLSILKAQQKLFKKLAISKAEIESKTKGDKKYELENLLNESSSDEDGKHCEPDEDNNSDDQEIEELEDWVEDLEAQTQQDSNLLEIEMNEKENNQIAEFNSNMTQRTEQLTNVTRSIGKIQDMFKSLNEIVS